MAGLGDGRAKGSGRGHLRAADADRERVIGVLKAAYVHGLVTKDEFDERVGQTFASRTYAELALVTADVPAGLPALPPVPARAMGRVPAHASVRRGDHTIIAAAVFTILALAAAMFLANPVSGLLVIAAVGSASAAMLLLGKQLRAERRDRRPGGRLPGQGAAHTGPRASLRAASAGPVPKSPRLPRPGKTDAASGRRPRPQLAG